MLLVCMNYNLQRNWTLQAPRKIVVQYGSGSAHVCFMNGAARVSGMLFLVWCRRRMLCWRWVIQSKICGVMACVCARGDEIACFVIISFAGGRTFGV